MNFETNSQNFTLGGRLHVDYDDHDDTNHMNAHALKRTQTNTIAIPMGKWSKHCLFYGTHKICVAVVLRK